ncbi:glutathione S-transferase N-terminal domain-containing protein [Rhodoferax sp. PAMC 29310]|uniref:glutathione S-transferase N-terminal domain-containing protein n=1 Tax=Rhodoferax sp. PAMC 29310 TaxID=2822760 RepID=UPI001B33CB12|nr:glutathione S-transferase N-terminal domain-containing protein [Rhodoferax sp. PAMC 29310]
MKIIIRTFFKTLRWVLGPVMVLREYLTRPTGLVRSPAEQARVDQQCEGLALYQYRTCPFCIKVRQEMRRLSLNVAQHDAQPDGPHRASLLAGGGQAKVPCLKITDETGQSQWMYESSAINAYLNNRFSRQST